MSRWHGGAISLADVEFDIDTHTHIHTHTHTHACARVSPGEYSFVSVRDQTKGVYRPPYPNGSSGSSPRGLHAVWGDGALLKELVDVCPKKSLQLCGAEPPKVRFRTPCEIGPQTPWICPGRKAMEAAVGDAMHYGRGDLVGGEGLFSLADPWLLGLRRGAVTPFHRWRSRRRTRRSG